MTESWAFGGHPPVLATDSTIVTLVEGSTFCLSATNGSIVPGLAHGLFVRDTRFVSGWLLDIDGKRLEPLHHRVPEPYAAHFLARGQPPPGRADSALLVQRHRYIGDGMREDVIVRNLASTPTRLRMTLRIEADFADLFQVKENRVRPRGSARWTVDERGIIGTFDGDRGVMISLTDPHTLDANVVSWTLEIAPHGQWRTCVQVEPTIDRAPLRARHPCGVAVEDTLPAVRLRAWRGQGPVVRSTDSTLELTIRRSLEDLGSLRIFDPDHPDRAAVAAGAPWFMALFGRDSLLASHMILPLDPKLALGTLQALADYQGTRSAPASEEQPGRILHEMRFGPQASLSLGGGNVYYGTADATPLFVMLLGEIRRWGADRDAVDALLPHADRALDWIDRFGDRDGDGFVEYERQTPNGLINQGWKDSWDGINFADGTLAEAPIALCEVQGYVYAAFTARAYLALDVGDDDTATYWTRRATRLKRSFNDTFWLPDHGWYAVGLDRDKRPIDALTSNIGHCLWTGIADPDKAAVVAGKLMSPEMFSGWGVRTLATTMSAYNPMSYHNGSVWPHDNALIATGLMRYGRVAEAQRIATAVLSAAAHFGGRLPELFCGFDSTESPDPVPYPTSCSPQSWSAATPVQLLRTLLRLEPDIPAGQVRISPAIPNPLLRLRVENLNLAQTRVTIDVTDSGWSVEGLPDHLKQVPDPQDAQHPHPYTTRANDSPGS